MGEREPPWSTVSVPPGAANEAFPKWERLCDPHGAYAEPRLSPRAVTCRVRGLGKSDCRNGCPSDGAPGGLNGVVGKPGCTSTPTTPASTPTAPAEVQGCPDAARVPPWPGWEGAWFRTRWTGDGGLASRQACPRSRCIDAQPRAARPVGAPPPLSSSPLSSQGHRQTAAAALPNQQKERHAPSCEKGQRHQALEPRGRGSAQGSPAGPTR